MKKLALITLIVLLSLTIYLLKLYENKLLEEQPTDLTVSYVGEGIETKEIKITNEKEEEIYTLSIDEVREWLTNNWDSFEEPPTVGMRTVEPENFNFFDRTASISPDNKTLIFSVHDYAVLTTESFVITSDIASKNLRLIKESVRGSIEKFIWSPDSLFVAYVLNTARSQGDYLSIDNIQSMKKIFTLDNDSLLKVLEAQDTDNTEFLPRFRELKWENEKLHFTTYSPEEKNLNWSINKDGENLTLVK